VVITPELASYYSLGLRLREALAMPGIGRIRTEVPIAGYRCYPTLSVTEKNFRNRFFASACDSPDANRNFDRMESEHRGVAS
jgi:hypothetical protein